MAIRILLDHGVREDRILFVTLLVARGGGVSILRRAFPRVTIVCGAVDDELQEGWLEGLRGQDNPEGLGRKVWVVQPGMGQIGTSHTVVCASNLYCLQGIVIIYRNISRLPISHYI